MWKITKLGDVCKIQSGNSIPVKEKEVLYRNVNDGLPYVATKDVGFDGVIDYENGVRIPPNHSSKFRLSKKNSILVCAEGGSAGRKIAFSNRDCHFVNKLFSINPGSEMTSKYVYYYTLSKEFQSQFKKSMHGLIGGVSLSKIKNFQIAHPPLSEQQRIVAKLDKIFAEINKTNTTEAQNKKNMIALEENLLHLLFQNVDIEKSTYSLSKLIDMGWIEGHLDGNHGSDYPRKNEFVENGVPYLSANCIVNGEIQTDNQKYLTEERASKIRKGIAINNDVLFAHNATVGPTAILKTDYPKVVLGTSLTYYRCKKNVVHPQYLMAYMTSKYFKSQYEAVMRQATRNQVPITKQREFSFIIPNYEQQVKIADTMDVARKNTKIIFNSRLKKIDNLNSLKSKILTNKLQSDAA